jgi:hypothetical protein
LTEVEALEGPLLGSASFISGSLSLIFPEIPTEFS